MAEPVDDAVLTGAPVLAPLADAGPTGLEVAVLDGDGVIISVNQAWREFAARNGGDADRTGVGVSYLEACEAALGDPAADAAAAAIRQALSGDLPAPVIAEIPCHGPAVRRWYDMLIAPNRDRSGRPAGATVTLTLARWQPPAGGALDDLLDQVTNGLFRIGWCLRAAQGQPHQVSGQHIAEALSEADSALQRIRAAAFSQRGS